MKNPFELTFGLKPSNYISRMRQTDEICNDFSNPSPSNHVYMITGTRGSGKTVLLSSIASNFAEKESWMVVELIPSIDMLEQLASKLYDSSVLHRIFNGKTFGFSFHGASFSIKGEKPVTNVVSLLEILMEKLNKKKARLLICVDEVSNNPFVKSFIQSFQLLLRKKHQIYLLMTGLYQNIYELQNDKSLTFLYRAPKILLEPLSLSSISNSYMDLLGLTSEEALNAAKITKGYAYAYQVIGHLLFTSKKKKMDRKLLSEFDQYLQEYVYDKTWSELSENDKKVLLAFESDEYNRVSDLINKTKMNKKTFSVYRDRLIKRGIIRNVEYGKLSINFPRFSAFLKYNK